MKEIKQKKPLQNVTLIAGTPGELEQAQNGLINWTIAKIESVCHELQEAEQNLELAKKNKWRSKPWQTQVNKHKRRITYYEKVRDALRAGYYIVPPFPHVDVFAIRTTKDKARKDSSTRYWPSFSQNPQLLPPGEGDYKSPDPQVWERTETITGKDGKEKNQVVRWPGKLLDVDFPFKTVKPQILEATQRAMSAKIFDTLGVLPRSGCGDPIVVGTIREGNGHSGRETTFFVSWWFDTEDL